MKYKVGDKVKIRSDLVSGILYGSYDFSYDMKDYRGSIVTIAKVWNEYKEYYDIEEDNGEHFWTDEMIEGGVEDMEKKEYKGWEILKEAKDGNIKKNTYFKVTGKDALGDNVDAEYFWSDFDFYDKNDNAITSVFSLLTILNFNFEIMEQPEEINIQDIEEITLCREENAEIVVKTNQIIRYLKQLDKKENK